MERRSVVAFVGALLLSASFAGAPHSSGPESDAAITTVHPVAHPRGVLATSGGWAYCLVVELAENARLLGAYSRTVPPIARD